MVDQVKAEGNRHDKAAATPGDWRLILAPRPSAIVTKYLTQPHPIEQGVLVEKYSTRFGWHYEKWIYPNGTEVWWKLVKIRST
jgi:hypothetical protein